MTQTLIEDNLEKADWKFNPRQTENASGASQTPPIRKGQGYWTVDMQWKFPRVDRAKFLIQASQAHKLEDGVELIQLHRPQRRNPYAFNADGAAGTVSAISVDTNDHEIDLTAGGELGVGDMVSYTTDAAGNRFLGEIVEIISRPATNRAVFTTRPRALDAHSTPNAVLFKAYGLFRAVKGSVVIDEPLKLGAPATVKASFKQVTI